MPIRKFRFRIGSDLNRIATKQATHLFIESFSDCKEACSCYRLALALEYSEEILYRYVLWFLVVASSPPNP